MIPQFAPLRARRCQGSGDYWMQHIQVVFECPLEGRYVSIVVRGRSDGWPRTVLREKTPCEDNRPENQNQGLEARENANHHGDSIAFFALSRTVVVFLLGYRTGGRSTSEQLRQHEGACLNDGVVDK